MCSDEIWGKEFSNRGRMYNKRALSQIAFPLGAVSYTHLTLPTKA